MLFVLGYFYSFSSSFIHLTLKHFPFIIWIWMFFSWNYDYFFFSLLRESCLTVLARCSQSDSSLPSIALKHWMEHSTNMWSFVEAKSLSQSNHLCVSGFKSNFIYIIGTHTCRRRASLCRVSITEWEDRQSISGSDTKRGLLRGAPISKLLMLGKRTWISRLRPAKWEESTVKVIRR